MRYVEELSESVKDQIVRDLKAAGYSNEDIELALNSKLSDLRDTIDIDKYL